MKLDKGTVKPVKWGVEDEGLDELESFGVKKFEDFTWKHMLDFYSCADCGRCSDNCPAHAVGRPLSPRFISIKCRDYSFKKYPLTGMSENDRFLIGNVLEEDEIWSCTTCGACEQECPLFIEYIDKIVDLRRGLVDEGMVPQSLQKPLRAIEKRGNPYGKMEKKRADWTKDLPVDFHVKILGKKGAADTLYFVDSVTSYDDRIQEIGRAAARFLDAAGIDFGILGPAERDSGHEVKRFGEEMLFQDLRDRNTDAILNSGAKNIVTADPHTFNALKNDYKGIPPVEHISRTIIKAVTSGNIRFKPVEDPGKIYTYHDPCYLGRHNNLYDDPRNAIDAIPGIKRIEMEGHCRDRSFCCGGGGLMLFYEPIEEKRMGQVRVEMAKQAGANVMVTACPFCMLNIEDAIKTSGLEGEMEAIDLIELIERHMIID
jgi:Fe-S oxidoreductase